MDNLPATQNGNLPALAQPGELSVEQVIAQAEKIQKVMKAVMRKGVHYGIIPGTPKPTLLKPGAEKLCMVFRLDPQYSIVKERVGESLNIDSTCTLYYIPTDVRLGSGMGSCSTDESKYAYRKGARLCPSCGEPTIRKGKPEYGGGWYCNAKDGGCGDKFKADEAGIADQETGRIANPDLADQHNTVLKMANKRSLIAAVLNVLAASDIFTQDVEDLQRKREATDGDERRQKPSDTITPAQWKALEGAANSALGADAKAWLAQLLKDNHCKRAGQLSVGAYAKAMTTLAERGRGEEPQDSPDPGDTFEDDARG
ncbi:MAG: hypothetical protein WAU89_23230 [Candidatus Acidiferrales bacterium]